MQEDGGLLKRHQELGRFRVLEPLLARFPQVHLRNLFLILFDLLKEYGVKLQFAILIHIYICGSDVSPEVLQEAVHAPVRVLLAGQIPPSNAGPSNW